MLVFIAAAAIWGLGVVLKTPVRLRLYALFGLWLGAVLAHALLADGNPVRLALGGDVRVWLALGVVVAGAAAYLAGLRALRRRAAPRGVAAPMSSFRPAELDRYARHIMLREIGGPGQKALKAAKVLVVGAGGLGAPVLLYLAGSGVGVIGVIDDDVVESSNLQRQVIHPDASIGMQKVFSAESAMRALNPFIEVRPYNRHLDEAVAMELIADYDLVLDGTDNFDTRELVNLVCARLGKPLISGSITQWEGQLTLFDPARGAPCRACIFPNRPAPGLVPTCAEAGVAAPLPGVIGAMMALEAVKEITGAGQGLRGRLMIHDALFAETRMIAIARREGCEICGAVQGLAQAVVPRP